MAQKLFHIRDLPTVQVPTEHPRDNPAAMISIPLFYSQTGYSSHFDDIHSFNEQKFRDILIKSAAWSCVSLLTNTDIGERGIPIYFYTDATVYESVVDELTNRYGVPEDWIVKMKLPEWEPDYICPDIGSPCLGKKLMALLDDTKTHAVKIILDADACVYRRIGDPILKWADIIETQFKDTLVFQFRTDTTLTDYEYVKWLREGVALKPPLQVGEETPAIKTEEIEAYRTLGLQTHDGRVHVGNQIMAFPTDHKIIDFVKANIHKIYIDEAAVSMYLQAKGNEEVRYTGIRDLGIPYLGFLEKDDFHNFADKSRFVHLCGYEDTYQKWFRTFARGIEGRHRENAIKLFQTPRRNIHIFPVAHNPVNPDFSPCAFSQKARKLAYMCTYTDHHVTFYGNALDKDIVACDEFVAVSDEQMLYDTYGDFRDQSNFYTFNSQDYNSRIMREKTIHNYGKRHAPGDILCYTFGHQQHELYDRLLREYGDALHIESGIGYYQPYMHYKVFETNSHLQYSYGEAGQRYWEWERIPEAERPKRDFNNTFHYGITQWQDKVICNSWGEDEFDYNPKKGGDYLLFIGRIVGGKGPEIAMRVAAALGKKLVVAGQGDWEKELGFQPWDCVELLGMVGPEKRRELYYNAEAVLAPTKYLDVLCGVCIEAGFAGRPIIGPDFGGPKEVILHQETGYTCRSFDQYVRATANAHLIDPADCRKNALRYTNEKIALQYDAYFDHISRYAENGCSIYWYYDLSRGIDW